MFFERSRVMAYRTAPLVSPAAIVSIIIFVAGFNVINTTVNPSAQT
jgi:hypothetical protein